MECIRHEILNNFQAANLYFFQSFRYNVTYEEVWETQPGKPSAWVTWRPSDQLKNLTGMVWTHQFHQNFPGDTIGGHYMKRKWSKENIREAERYSKIVSGIPSVALPPRRDIPWKLPERGGGGVYRPAWHWSKMLFFASVFRSGFRKFYLIHNTFFGTFKSASVTEHQHS